jgi:flagellar FliL protein
MAEPETEAPAKPGKKSKLPFIIGGVLALLAAGGGFFATYSGLLFGHDDTAAEHAAEPDALPDIAFVPVDRLVISLGDGASNRHLQMTSQLEVDKPHQAEVQLLMPRILDVLNGYLRAVEPAQLESSAALVALRAQMLRRIQIVTGEGRVRDLLITEFVLN